MPDRGPIPPDDLVIRIGVSASHFTTTEERVEIFRKVGRQAYDDVVACLPDGWSWEGKRALDFGCGSGRMLRWFHPHIDDGLQLAGCDIHEPTIEWMRTAFPDVEVFVNGESPPLADQPDASFDLIFSGSVFSHLPDWAPWVLEMRRVLKPGGLLICSIHSRGFWGDSAAARRGEAWDEDATGLVVEGAGDRFDDGGWGPAVYASEWWLRAHWGRALEIVNWQPSGFAWPDDRSVGQACVVARRPEDDRALTTEDLLAPADDPREVVAALRAQRMAYDEVQEKRASAVGFWQQIQQLSGVHEHVANVQAELDRTQARVKELEAELARRPAQTSELARIARGVRRRLGR